MRDTLHQFAEEAANRVSRRKLLGWLGRVALSTVLAAGAVALPRAARAARPCPPGYKRCKVPCKDGCRGKYQIGCCLR
jgi:hypothetical protein